MHTLLLTYSRLVGQDDIDKFFKFVAHQSGIASCAKSQGAIVIMRRNKSKKTGNQFWLILGALSVKGGF
jgi:hypothetical protein